MQTLNLLQRKATRLAGMKVSDHYGEFLRAVLEKGSPKVALFFSIHIRIFLVNHFPTLLVSLVYNFWKVLIHLPCFFKIQLLGLSKGAEQ